jgi:putative ABC transport system permease protein
VNLVALAARNTLRNRRRSALTALAFAVGAFAVVLLRGASEGFVTLVLDEVVRGRTGAIQVHPVGYVEALEALPTWLTLPEDNALAAEISKVPGVSAVTPRLRFTALASNGTAEAPVLVRGVDTESELRVCPSFGRDVVAPGRALGPGDEGTVLGRVLGRTFGINADPAGAQVTLAATSPSGRSNALAVPVRGLSALALPFENKRVVVLPLKTAQQLVGLAGRVSEYAVDVADLEHPEPTVAQLRSVLGSRAEVHSWKELEPYARDTVKRQRLVVVFVAFVLGLIVLLGIASTTAMGVHERTREIGTLLALGLRRSQITRLFVAESTLLALLGATAGSITGAALVSSLHASGIHLALLDTALTLRPELDGKALLGAFALALIGGGLAALLASRSAAKLDPAEALRDG